MFAGSDSALTSTPKVDQVHPIWEEPEKKKENNLGKEQCSRKLV